MTPLIADSMSTAGLPVRSVGAKAANLAWLSASGFNVPDFFVVRSEAFARHLSENGLTWPPEPPEQIVAAELPGEVAGAITAAYQRLAAANPMVAVRSSGADEDSAQDSFAGQFDSILGVRSLPNVMEAIKRCWASSVSDRSAGYRETRGIPLGKAPRFGVIVQSQIYPTKAGVVFTVHPMDPESAYIEANFGTGESVVASLVTPDGITISRSGGTVVEARIAAKRRMTVVAPDREGSTVVDIEESMQRVPVLTNDEAKEVFRLGMQIEALAGQPQDIEWAIDPQGTWILQARPITLAAC